VRVSQKWSQDELRGGQSTPSFASLLDVALLHRRQIESKISGGGLARQLGLGSNLFQVSAANESGGTALSRN